MTVANIGIKPRPSMCYKEAIKMPPMPLVGRTVTSDRFQMFETRVAKTSQDVDVVRFHGRRRVIVEGAASSRPAAKYSADRALFMLLLSVPWKLRQRKPSKGPL